MKRCPRWVLLGWLALGCMSPADEARELLTRSESVAAPRARVLLAEAVALDPSLRAAWSRLADLELGAEHWSEAEDAARRANALSVEPHDLETEAAAATAQNQWVEAEARWRRVTESAPDRGLAHQRLADALVHLGRFDDALASYRVAVELGFDEAKVEVARLLLVRLRGEVVDFVALEELQTTLANAPDSDEVRAMRAELETLEQRARVERERLRSPLRFPSEGAAAAAVRRREAERWRQQNAEILDAFEAGAPLRDFHLGPRTPAEPRGRVDLLGRPLPVGDGVEGLGWLRPLGSSAVTPPESAR